MADNVLFKKGLQSGLNGLTSFVKGSFYLTTDTKKLYFANGTTKADLLDLNQYIRTTSVEFSTGNTTTQFPNIQQGDIYYNPTQNILAIANKINPDGKIVWTQLNPDTDTYSTSTAFVVAVSDAVATITNTIEQNAGDALSGNFKIKAGSNVHLAKDADGSLTISADNDTTNTTYTLGHSAGATGSANVTLTPNSGAAQSINIKGTGSATVSNTTGGIEINVPETDVTAVSMTFNANGGLTTTVGVDGDTETSTAITPTISYGAGNTKSTAVFNSGTASLNVYTKDETDTLITDKLKTFDAMEYKGTVSSTDAATKLATTATIGSTYKATNTIEASAIPGSGVAAKAGDLIIAEKGTGTEGQANGVKWTIVPSGDDQSIDVQVTTQNSNKAIRFAVRDNETEIGTLQVNSDTATTDRVKLEVVPTVSGNNGSFYIKHGDKLTSGGTDVATTGSAHTQSEQGTQSIEAITSLSYDAAGHIVGATKEKFTFTDTHNTVSDIAFAVGANATTNPDGVKATLTVTNSDGAASVASDFSIKSSSLKITSAANRNISVELEWGSF